HEIAQDLGQGSSFGEGLQFRFSCGSDSTWKQVTAQIPATLRLFAPPRHFAAYTASSQSKKSRAPCGARDFKYWGG
ncbi:MAG: hypothetical protein O9327_07710, partial [Polaromonas sp.]|nr:hypothetical protein [Polaromonas sp.]